MSEVTEGDAASREQRISKQRGREMKRGTKTHTHREGADRPAAVRERIAEAFVTRYRQTAAVVRQLLATAARLHVSDYSESESIIDKVAGFH